VVDVITSGELLIDFVSTVSGVTLIEAPAFKKAAGGAPANVAVGVVRLGLSSGFMGKVGDDDFGRFLTGTLDVAGVDTSRVLFDPAARTALAFVSLTAEGERDFLFYRHPSADMLIRADEIDLDYVRAARVFHYGSISLIDEPSRGATLAAVQAATEAGLLISYDPNLRRPLWPSAEAAREGMLLGWQYAHVAKVSEEELTFLTGLPAAREAEAVRQLWHDELRLLVVTRGAAGASLFTASARADVPGFRVNTIDTTGAGDAFVAGLLTRLDELGDAWHNPDALEQVGRFANAAGALTTTERGAIPALPRREAVEQFLGEDKW
jgi:fructokinase